MPSVYIDPAKYQKQATEAALEEHWKKQNIEKLFDTLPLSNEAKRILRDGIPDRLRGKIWGRILGVDKISIHDKDYRAGLFRFCGKPYNADPDVPAPDPLTLGKPPTFGSSTILATTQAYLALSPEGIKVQGRILCILGSDFPQVEICPFIPSLVGILLHHMEPDDVLGSITAMIRNGMAGGVKPRPGGPASGPSGPWGHFPLNRRDIKLFNLTFRDLVLQRGPSRLSQALAKLLDLEASSIKHVEGTEKMADDQVAVAVNRKRGGAGKAKPKRRIRPVWENWFMEMFLTTYSLQQVFGIIDCFLLEGYKILYRFAIGPLLVAPIINHTLNNPPPNPSAKASGEKPPAGGVHLDDQGKPIPPGAMVIVVTGKHIDVTTMEAFNWSLTEFVRRSVTEQNSLDRLRKAAESLSFSRKHMDLYRQRHLESIDTSMNNLSMAPSHDGLAQGAGGDGAGGSMYDLKPKSYYRPIPTLHGTSKILTDGQFAQLWRWVPSRLRIKDLRLVFSTDTDGTSLQTFYQRASGFPHSILVVKTVDRGASQPSHVIGAFCGSDWGSRHGESYFGTGETFLFSLVPHPETFRWVGLLRRPCGDDEEEDQGDEEELEPAWGDKEDDDPKLKVSNHYAPNFFMCGAKDHIAVGGGGGHGIWLDQNLDKGRSETCTTFLNPPLSARERFEVAKLELWVILT